MALSNERDNKDFIVAIIITDGNTDDIKGDCEVLVEASKQPICFVGVGVTKDINYDMMKKFDDLKSRKFDNFQFVDIWKLPGVMTGREERPDLIFVLAMFNEIPKAYQKVKKSAK